MSKRSPDELLTLKQKVAEIHCGTKKVAEDYPGIKWVTEDLVSEDTRFNTSRGMLDKFTIQNPKES